tara:strand:+ start:4537 stop:6096 length:1560 start_codon:yes stop_codon:yes gene_type:complete
MAENDGLKLFGFEIKRARKDAEDKKLPSVVPPRDDEGGSYATAAGTHYGQYLNLDGDDSKDNYQLIMKYRGNAMHPEVDAAIEDIVNESITGSEMSQTLELNLDEVKAPDRVKKLIKEEFDNIYGMLNFKELGHDIFRRWYIDGRLYHHLVVNEDRPKDGIQEIRPMDSAKMRKVKKVKYKKDPITGAKIVEKTDEFFIYQEKPGQSTSGIKMTNDSVSYVTSGLLTEDRKKIVSHIHKALKPINQLRMMEDALVIYRLARAPERRIFYIDVGNLPRGKSEQYMKDIMAKYRNKLVYDAKTGEIRDDRKHQSLLEDFWLPRREGGRGTEITTLPGGENLGQIEDIVYFQKRMYRSLNVPISRMDTEAVQGFLGRSTEVNRDELKFQKFIDRLRMRFSHLFYGILKKQLIMKGVITEEDWEEWKNDITVDYVKDNHFAELRDAEMLRERLQSMDMIQQYVGEYFSKEWVQKNVLMLDDETIEQMKKDIAGEGEEEPDEEQQDTPPSAQRFELKPVAGDEQ